MLGQEQLTQKGLTQRYLTQRAKLFVPKLLFQGSTGWWRVDNVEKDLFDAVSILYDNSVNGFHMIQNTQVSKPIFVENQLNGNSTLRFDGSNDFMKVDFGQMFTQPNTIFLVGKRNATGLMYFVDGISTSRAGMISNYNGNNITIFSGTSLITYSRPFSTDYFLFTGIFNSTNSQIYENTILRATGNAGTSGVTGLTLGARNTLAEYLNGDIAELIFFNRLLTQPETQIVNNYISQKYGLF